MNFWWPYGIPKKTRQEADARLTRITALSRDPVLYTDAGVPDTLDGRFQLLGLFTALELMKINDKKLRQALFDRLFIVCEISLREIGVGDLSVAKKLKAMMLAFHGHATAYEACMKGEADWSETLLRNVYGTREDAPGPQEINILMDKIRADTV